MVVGAATVSGPMSRAASSWSTRIVWPGAATAKLLAGSDRVSTAPLGVHLDGQIWTASPQRVAGFSAAGAGVAPGSGS